MLLKQLLEYTYPRMDNIHSFLERTFVCYAMFHYFKSKKIFKYLFSDTSSSVHEFLNANAEKYAPLTNSLPPTSESNHQHILKDIEILIGTIEENQAKQNENMMKNIENLLANLLTNQQEDNHSPSNSPPIPIEIMSFVNSEINKDQEPNLPPPPPPPPAIDPSEFIMEEVIKPNLKHSNEMEETLQLEVANQLPNFTYQLEFEIDTDTEDEYLYSLEDSKKTTFKSFRAPKIQKYPHSSKVENIPQIKSRQNSLEDKEDIRMVITSSPVEPNMFTNLMRRNSVHLEATPVKNMKGAENLSSLQISKNETTFIQSTAEKKGVTSKTGKIRLEPIAKKLQRTPSISKIPISLRKSGKPVSKSIIWSPPPTKKHSATKIPVTTEKLRRKSESNVTEGSISETTAEEDITESEDLFSLASTENFPTVIEFESVSGEVLIPVDNIPVAVDVSEVSIPEQATSGDQSAIKTIGKLEELLIEIENPETEPSNNILQTTVQNQRKQSQTGEKNSQEIPTLNREKDSFADAEQQDLHDSNSIDRKASTSQKDNKMLENVKLADKNIDHSKELKSTSEEHQTDIKDGVPLVDQNTNISESIETNDNMNEERQTSVIEEDLTVNLLKAPDSDEHTLEGKNTIDIKYEAHIIENDYERQDTVKEDDQFFEPLTTVLVDSSKQLQNEHEDVHRSNIILLESNTASTANQENIPVTDRESAVPDQKIEHQPAQVLPEANIVLTGKTTEQGDVSASDQEITQQSVQRLPDESTVLIAKTTEQENILVPDRESAVIEEVIKQQSVQDFLIQQLKEQDAGSFAEQNTILSEITPTTSSDFIEPTEESKIDEAIQDTEPLDPDENSLSATAESIHYVEEFRTSPGHDDQIDEVSIISTLDNLSILSEIPTSASDVIILINSENYRESSIISMDGDDERYMTPPQSTPSRSITPMNARSNSSVSDDRTSQQISEPIEFKLADPSKQNLSELVENTQKLIKQMKEEINFDIASYESEDEYLGEEEYTDSDDWTDIDEEEDEYYNDEEIEEEYTASEEGETDTEYSKSLASSTKSLNSHNSHKDNEHDVIEGNDSIPEEFIDGRDEKNQLAESVKDFVNKVVNEVIDGDSTKIGEENLQQAPDTPNVMQQAVHNESDEKPDDIDHSQTQEEAIYENLAILPAEPLYANLEETMNAMREDAPTQPHVEITDEQNTTIELAIEEPKSLDNKDVPKTSESRKVSKLPTPKAKSPVKQNKSPPKRSKSFSGPSSGPIGLSSVRAIREEIIMKQSQLAQHSSKSVAHKKVERKASITEAMAKFIPQPSTSTNYKTSSVSPSKEMVQKHTFKIPKKKYHETCFSDDQVTTSEEEEEEEESSPPRLVRKQSAPVFRTYKSLLSLQEPEFKESPEVNTEILALGCSYRYLVFLSFTGNCTQAFN